MTDEALKAVVGELVQATDALRRFLETPENKYEILTDEVQPRIWSAIQMIRATVPSVKGCGHCRAHLERCKPCHYICPKCATVYTDNDCEHRRLLPHFGCPACGAEVPVPGPGVPA